MAQRDDYSRPVPSLDFGKCGKIATPPIRSADRGLAMPASAIIARAIAAAIIVVAAPVAGSAQPTLKIFDAHLHYNQEPDPYYPLERVRAHTAAHEEALLKDSSPGLRNLAPDLDLASLCAP